MPPEINIHPHFRAKPYALLAGHKCPFLLHRKLRETQVTKQKKTLP